MTNEEGKSVDSTIWKAVLGLSIVVFLVVVALYNLPEADSIPPFVTMLPKINAFINGTCSILLITSVYFIKQGKVPIHKFLNITTFLLSSLFLISYITYHAFGIETKYPADSPLRMLYFFILITHIILAAGVLPLVLMSFYFGLLGKIEQHRKIVRFSFPIWLYVTVTGVIVYLMISPYYNFEAIQ
ncbi:MAG: DUF420 domain-containing protein [Flavobacteriales bacterium]|nr:DUF420 domain-containing protein [Flavobacteriales bacterium]